jgi:tetratricopeptide (TPR) repeat protein
MKDGKIDEAVSTYRQVLGLRPDYADAHYNLGNALREQGALADALAHYGRTLVLEPNYAEARFAQVMAQLPVLYADEAEIAQRRAAYEKELRALCADVENGRATGDLAGAVGSNQPFYLACQGEDDRALQALHGELVCKIMAARFPPATLAKPPAAGERVRVGIVSGFFNDHTVWKLMLKGWLGELDRRRFRVMGYFTSADSDAIASSRARSRSSNGGGRSRPTPRTSSSTRKSAWTRSQRSLRRSGSRRSNAARGDTLSPAACRRSTISSPAT